MRSSLGTSAKAGAAVGAVAGVAMLALLVWWLLRRRRRQKNHQHENEKMYPTGNMWAQNAGAQGQRVGEIEGKVWRPELHGRRSGPEAAEKDGWPKGVGLQGQGRGERMEIDGRMIGGGRGE